MEYINNSATIVLYLIWLYAAYAVFTKKLSLGVITDYKLGRWATSFLFAAVMIIGALRYMGYWFYD